MLYGLGCLFIICATTIIGFILGENYKKRSMQLSEIERVIYELENDIVYTYTPLPQALENISKKSLFPVNEILYSISSMLQNNDVDGVYDAFVKAFSQKKEYLCLKNEDINILTDFSKTLGQTDIEGEKKVFALTHEKLKKQISKAEILMDKNVKMYRYLGFSLGAVIIILLL